MNNIPCVVSPVFSFSPACIPFLCAGLLLQRAEAKFLRSILPQYYAHHRDNPESFLIRFCGMYLVKNGHKKIPFIVMKW